MNYEREKKVGDRLTHQDPDGAHGAGLAVAEPVIPVVPEADGAFVPPGGNPFVRLFASLSNPGFRWLWFGTLFSMAAMQMNIISQPWLAYDLSDSATVLGLVALARGVPMFAFSFLGGVAADRFDKRNLLIATQLLLSLLALSNAILVHSGAIQVWHLAVLAMIQGTIFPFNMPARQAIIPEIVGPQKMGNAIALTSTAMNLNRVLAPTIAGVLLAFHPSYAFFAIAALYGLSAVTLIGLPRRRSFVGDRGLLAPRGSALSEIMVGLRYVRGNTMLLTLISFAFIVVLLGMPFQQFLPVFQKEILHINESGLGLMYGFIGIGSLMGSLTMAYFADSPRTGVIQMVFGGLFGIALVAFALSSTLPIALGFLLMLGVVSQGYMTINNVLIMQNTNPALYGRVMSVYMMTWSLMPLSVMPMGALVDRMGAPTTIVGVGLLLTLFFVVAAIAKPALWRKRAGVAIPAS